MPIHDWTKVRAGTFHHFRQRWASEIAAAFNTGSLPPNYFALMEPRLQQRGVNRTPKTRFRKESDSANYARRADRIAIRHNDGDLVAVLEIVSPGNKNNGRALRSFVRKAVEFLRNGVHVFIVDVFPPSRFDPQGIDTAIWKRLAVVELELPKAKPLTIASYKAGQG